MKNEEKKKAVENRNIKKSHAISCFTPTKTKHVTGLKAKGKYPMSVGDVLAVAVLE